MDEFVLRRSVEALTQAIQQRDLDSVAQHLADDLRTRHFTVAGQIESYEVVAVEAHGSEGVVRARCRGDRVNLLESSWTEPNGTPRLLSFAGPAATLELRWTEEHGSPRLISIGVNGGPKIPP
jgi:hypothetical protein